MQGDTHGWGYTKDQRHIKTCALSSKRLYMWQYWHEGSCPQFRGKSTHIKVRKNCNTFLMFFIRRRNIRSYTGFWEMGLKNVMSGVRDGNYPSWGRLWTPGRILGMVCRHFCYSRGPNLGANLSWGEVHVLADLECAFIVDTAEAWVTLKLTPCK